jgi:hypothetical protein
MRERRSHLCVRGALHYAGETCSTMLEGCAPLRWKGGVVKACPPPLVSDAASSAAGIRRRLIRRWCQTPPRPPLVSDAASSAAGVRHRRTPPRPCQTPSPLSPRLRLTPPRLRLTPPVPDTDTRKSVRVPSARACVRLAQRRACAYLTMARGSPTIGRDSPTMAHRRPPPRRYRRAHVRHRADIRHPAHV